MIEDYREAYNYTILDIGSSLSCPQCRALELLQAIGGNTDVYSQGQRMACRVILGVSHDCGKPTRMVSIQEGGQG